MAAEKKPFREKVFTVVSKIPKGKTATYAQVAKAAGSPNAARAVGNVLARNPHPIIIPCHRVVRSDGTVGGYLGKKGSKKKRALLEAEGASFKNNRTKADW